MKPLNYIDEHKLGREVRKHNGNKYFTAFYDRMILDELRKTTMTAKKKKGFSIIKKIGKFLFSPIENRIQRRSEW